MVSTHLDIFSCGMRASDFIESNSIPAKESVVAGPQVFSGANNSCISAGIGFPRSVRGTMDI